MTVCFVIIPTPTPKRMFYLLLLSSVFFSKLSTEEDFNKKKKKEKREGEEERKNPKIIHTTQASVGADLLPGVNVFVGLGRQFWNCVVPIDIEVCWCWIVPFRVSPGESGTKWGMGGRA